MRFWLSLIAVVLIAVAARALGWTGYLDMLADACIVVLGAFYLVHVARGGTRR